MLTTATKVKNLAFLAVSVLVLGDIGVRYAHLGASLGLTGDYTVHVQLPETGGLYQDADVTYRGVSVGRVGAITLTAGGVDAELRISDGAPRIPSVLRAVVADRSAVGEQYLDLQPSTDQGPYLADGSVVPQSETSTPVAPAVMLESVDQLTRSVPLDSLRTVVDELGKTFNGRGSDLQALLDTSSKFLDAADRAEPATTQLIGDSSAVLDTQAAESGALLNFASSANQLAAQLNASDTDLRRLITAAPQADVQVTALLRQLDPQLSVLLANLTTTSELMVTRQHGIQELLVRLPEVVHDGSTAITSSGARFGMTVTFFSPLPCTSGYGGTQYRNGLDLGTAPFNTGAHCAAPAGSGSDVRGAANAPHGGVPQPALPGSLSGGGGTGGGTGGDSGGDATTTDGPSDLAGLLGSGDLTP